MTVTKGSSAYYKRPLFRVSSPRMIVLDVTLYPPLRSCDSGIISVTRPDGTPEKTETAVTPDEFRDECGGWDRFPIFSREDRSFELLVRYYSRRRSDGERVYGSGFQNPVVVTFNLFSLTADDVTYDVASRTLLATGNVTITKGSAGVGIDPSNYGANIYTESDLFHDALHGITGKTDSQIASLLNAAAGSSQSANISIYIMQNVLSKCSSFAKK
jgi:hypothetical protein